MNFLGPAPAPSGRHPASTSPARANPRVAATRGRGSTRPAAYSWTVAARAVEALRMPTEVTSFNTRSLVSTGVGDSMSDLDHTLDQLQVQLQLELQRPNRPSGRVGGIDDGVQHQVGQLFGRPDITETSVPANPIDRSERPTRCTWAPCMAAHNETSNPMVPGPRTSRRSPTVNRAAHTDRSALPPRSTSAPVEWVRSAPRRHRRVKFSPFECTRPWFPPNIREHCR